MFKPRGRKSPFTKGLRRLVGIITPARFYHLQGENFAPYAFTLLHDVKANKRLYCLS